MDDKKIFLKISLNAQKFNNCLKPKQGEGNGRKQFEFQNCTSEKFDQFQIYNLEEHLAKFKVFQMSISWWSFGDKTVR